jgi:vacuolar-type H+-ATPase subunit C/Vma6
MTVPLLRTFADNNSMEGLVAALTAWNMDLCSALDRALPEYQQAHNVAVFEEALDRAYFVDNVRALSVEDDDSRILRFALQMEIDRINVRTLLQLREPGLSAEALTARLLPQGTLRAKTLRDMASADNATHAIEFLAPTIYRSLAEKLYIFVQSGRFSPLERLFDLLLVRHLKREALTHLMSIAVLMHFAWVKHNEVVNLRLIARGEASRLPRSRIREEVMYA